VAPTRSKASKSQAAAKLPSRKTADKSKAPKTRTAEPSKKRVDFKIHACARQVSVAGSFNEWDPSAKALRQGKDAVWRT
jgi:1,4-alpha-glucan branching enzyme